MLHSADPLVRDVVIDADVASVLQKRRSPDWVQR
jgi:hypothetical protein